MWPYLMQKNYPGTARHAEVPAFAAKQKKLQGILNGNEGIAFQAISFNPVNTQLNTDVN